MGGVALVTPTFRRPALLARLLADLARQTLQPDRCIVVCGEGGSSKVRRALEAAARGGVAPPLRLIPSTQANLPFQRRLGWEAAAGSEYLVYLDDDLELPAVDALERLLEPLENDPGLAGVTAPIEVSGSAPPGRPLPAGAARRTAAGGLTPTGVRLAPDDTVDAWSSVEWLRGGAMAFRRNALDRDSFPADLFALAAIGCGLGEDLVLARRARVRGGLALARRARFVHPGADVSRAYAAEGRRRAFAHAYSRRLVNDHYRAPAPPRLTDRLALLRTWIGGGVRRLAAGDREEAFGYLAGAWEGWLAPPRAARLTPLIDWEEEARRSLSGEEAFA